MKALKEKNKTHKVTIEAQITSLYWFIGEIEISGVDSEGKRWRWTGKPEDVGYTMNKAKQMRDGKERIEFELV